MVVLSTFPEGTFKQVDLAAWVQAVGSVVAILATGVSVWWAHCLERSRIVEAERLMRSREFIAARAFLPSAISELSTYCRDSAEILRTRWDSLTQAQEPFSSRGFPTLPPTYREVFSNCIRHAEPSVVSYLSNILVCLQVQDSRLHSVCDPQIEKCNLMSYMCSLADLYAQLSHLFNFARGEEEFSPRTLDWRSFETAYHLLKIHPEFHVVNNDDLRAYTERQISYLASKNNK